ncbi:MAG TPA: MetQ/NlpA family ABC transporter substrate-binding protein, partial [Anaerolineaceae bacterium]|nr:MetQ/NlpA family ABC transporter substrate-binding protein [Anaerolineaceae bacterium]
SGVGKDSVIKELRNRQLPLQFVVTATSRPPRQGERNGIDYIFVSPEEFERMIAGDELIEHALVYNQYKGVPKAHIQKALESGQDNPYVNILAVKRGNEQNPGILKLISLLNSPEVKKYIESHYAGSVLPAFGD